MSCFLPHADYICLSPQTMFRDRSARSYASMYAEDWRSITSYYGDEQLLIIYDWLYKRIRSLSFGQYIVIEKDALSLSSNLWLKGKFVQWNIPDDQRIVQFRRITYLMIEWIWRNNLTVRWQMIEQDGETHLLITPCSNAAILKFCDFFGHWPLSQPSISKLINQ